MLAKDTKVMVVLPYERARSICASYDGDPTDEFHECARPLMYELASAVAQAESPLAQMEVARDAN